MGAWSMDDEGNFELDPNFQQYLDQVHNDGLTAYQCAMTLFVKEKADEGAETVRVDELLRVASEAWQEAMFRYIIEHAPKAYTQEALKAELLKRVGHENVEPSPLLDGFVIDALEGEI